MFRIASMIAAALAARATFAQIAVFADDFESGVPAQVAPGVATPTGVQGYAGLGTPGNQFGGSFLRSPTGNVVSLTLEGLPAHDALSIDMLFAAIDSLDGTGTFPEGDFFTVTLDGVVIFRESFANAEPTQIQSYDPPAEVILARRVDLGFTGPGSWYTDSAYDMSIDPDFNDLPHSAPTATITFQIEGPGIQPLSDESWAIDNLSVTVSPSACSPADITTQGAGVGDPGYGVPDGLVTAADLNYFVNAWVALDLAIADVTTTGAGIGDPNYGVPDGAVTGADIQYYVNLWVVGCP